MFTGIDHLVILVDQLDDAMETYRELGFQVIRGGEHPGGTHNALVAFRDGSYLELIAFQEPERPHDHRWHRFLQTGGGLIDYALGVDDVPATVAKAQAAGLDYKEPVPGARKRPDGEQVAWRLGQPTDTWTGELPFLIDDVTPRSVRVPSGAEAVQPNGVIGMQGIVIAVRDLGESVDRFSRLFDVTAPDSETDETLQAQTATFTVGPHQITLAYPSDPSSPLVQHIQSKGDGPYQAILLAEGSQAPREIDPSTAHGARFIIAPAG